MKKFKKLIIFAFLPLLLLFFNHNTYAWGIEPIGSIRINLVDSDDSPLSYYDETDQQYKTFVLKAGKANTEYNIELPNIDGYYPEIKNVSGIFNGDQTTTVKYYNNALYNLTINYLYNDENISETYTTSLTSGSEYNIESPNIVGYIPNIKTVSGTITQDTEIDVIYTKNKYDLVIHFKDIDNNKIYDDINNQYEYLDKYKIELPNIYGYHLNNYILEGTIEENLEFDIIYNKNKYELVINYIDENGKTLKSNTYEYEYLDNYKIILENIAGYNHIDYVEGKILKDDEINVECYKNIYTITIHYLNVYGHKIKHDTVYKLKYNEYYNIKPIEIAGYNSLSDEVKGVIYGNLEINFYYIHKICTLTIHYINIFNEKIFEDQIFYLLAYKNYIIELPSIYGYYLDDFIYVSIAQDTEIYVVYTYYKKLSNHYISRYMI